MTLPGAFGKREVTMCLVRTYCGHTSAIQTQTEETRNGGWGRDGAYNKNKKRKWPKTLCCGSSCDESLHCVKL